MKSKQVKFLFTRQSVPTGTSRGATIARGIGALAGRLADEKRTFVWAPGGRLENVSEHSHMVGIVATALAREAFTDYDAGLVAQYATVHDIVEAYVGDTPTHRIDETGLLDKEELEAAGLQQLKQEYSDMPAMLQLIDEYEAQEVPEARFVRMVDKLMPLLAHMNDSVRTYAATEIETSEIHDNALRVATRFRREYPEMEPLIALRQELAAQLIALVDAHRKFH